MASLGQHLPGNRLDVPLRRLAEATSQDRPAAGPRAKRNAAKAQEPAAMSDYELAQRAGHLQKAAQKIGGLTPMPALGMREMLADQGK